MESIAENLLGSLTENRAANEAAVNNDMTDATAEIVTSKSGNIRSFSRERNVDKVVTTVREVKESP